MPPRKNYGNWSIDSTTYDFAESYNEGLAFIERGYRQSFIDLNGKVAIRHSSKRHLEPKCCCGRVMFSTQKGTGFLDRNGNVVVKPKPLEMENFSNGRSIVSDGDKYGIIGLNGEFVVPLKYDYIDNFSDGLACFSKNGNLGYLDINGNVVINPVYSNVSSFREGLAKAQLPNKKHTIIDTSGKKIFPAGKYKSIKLFSEGLLAVKYKSLWGFLDRFGEVAIAPSFRKVRGFREGLAAVQSDNLKWGFIDTKGKQIIDFVFADACSFSEGLAVVREMHTWGYINKSGNFIIEPQFMEASDISEGFSVVTVYSGMRFVKFM